MNKRMIIAVDGYSSCGKSSFARLIALDLNYIYIDSGAMYRAVALFCLNNGMITSNGMETRRIIKALKDIRIEFIYNPDTMKHETFLNGANVEEEIRRDNISGFASRVSQISEVRSKMVDIQRKTGIFKSIVMDGRDIGTVVFPDADLKIFMIASVDVRAKRRYDELIGKGYEADYEEIRKNVVERDHADENRAISPLRKADDAIVLDNSHMTIDEQMTWFRELIKTRNRED